jgi:hypothetical protein
VGTYGDWEETSKKGEVSENAETLLVNASASAPRRCCSRGIVVVAVSE